MLSLKDVQDCSSVHFSTSRTAELVLLCSSAPFISHFIFICRAVVCIDSIHSLPYPLAAKDFVAFFFACFLFKNWYFCQCVLSNEMGVRNRSSVLCIVGNFPPPTTPEELGARILIQERYEKFGESEEVEMEVESDEEDEKQEKADEPPAQLDQDTQVQDMDEVTGQ